MENNTNFNKTKIILGLGFLTLILICSALWLFAKRQDRPNTQIVNPDHSTDMLLGAEEIARIENSASAMVRYNYSLPKDKQIAVFVRPSSLRKESKAGNNFVSFVIDIDEYKLSYTGRVEIGRPSDIFLYCAPRTVSKYPDSYCMGYDHHSTIDLELAKYLPFVGRTEAGKQFGVFEGHDATGKGYLGVSSYACDQDSQDKALAAAKAWVKSKNLKPEIFPFKVFPGVCNN